MPSKKQDLGAWTQVGPESLLLYKLPAGVVENCRVEEQPGDRRYLKFFIGTNKGVFFVGVERGQKLRTATSVGLKHMEISEIKLDDDNVIVTNSNGEIYQAKSYVLKGER